MSDSNCLGADCTTGVWLILEMINNPSTQRIIYPLAPLVCCVMSLVYKTASPHVWIDIFRWKARGWPLPYLVHFPYHEEELAFLSAIISIILFCLNYLIEGWPLPMSSGF